MVGAIELNSIKISVCGSLMGTSPKERTDLSIGNGIESPWITPPGCAWHSFRYHDAHDLVDARTIVEKACCNDLVIFLAWVCALFKRLIEVRAEEVEQYCGLHRGPNYTNSKSDLGGRFQLRQRALFDSHVDRGEPLRDWRLVCELIEICQ